MPKFLFWNLNKRDILGLVGRLARDEAADLVILAECTLRPEWVLKELNTESGDYEFAWGLCDGLKFFTRFRARFLKPVSESSRISIRRLNLPARQTILIAAAHLPSKMGFSDASQVFESVHLSRMIERVENDEGHHRTVLLGDLNMNPFEPGIVGARGGLHAVMSRRIAARHTRTVQGEKCRFFYNPMWSHLGDRTDTGGSYFYDQGEPVCYFWNMYDQVLLRPELLQDFSPEQVHILSQVRGMSLLEDGRPDKGRASDHLPVVVELNF